MVESWSLAYEVLDGDPAEPEVWSDLDRYLKRRWEKLDGKSLPISAACVDTGGAHTEISYQFCKDRLGRKIWGIKGESAQGGKRSPIWPPKRPTSRTKKTYRPIIIGVNAAKDAVRDRLHKASPGPGYMHFPADRDLGYFSQLIAERRLPKYANGHRYYVWDLPSGRANEALDCRVYAYAALRGLAHGGLKLNRKADELGCPVTLIDDDRASPVAQLFGAVGAAAKAVSQALETARSPAEPHAAAQAPSKPDVGQDQPPPAPKAPEPKRIGPVATPGAPKKSRASRLARIT